VKRPAKNIVFASESEYQKMDASNIIVPKKREDMVAPYTWVDPEIKKMSLSEEIAWREEEIRRWSDGHNGLRGSHYFMLSQGFVKLPNGSTVRPWWRDTDAGVHEQYNNDFERCNSLYIFKRRRFALSTIFGGFEPLRLSLTNPGAVCGFTSCDVPRGNEMFREKLLVAFNNFDSRWNISNMTAKDLNKLEKDNGVHLPPWRVFKTSPGTRDGTQIRIGFYEKQLGDTFGENAEDDMSYKLLPTGDVSQIRYAQTARKKEDAAAFEGSTMKYIFVDEFFLHPFASKVLASSESSLSEDFIRTGMFVTGGSSGEMSTQGIALAQKVLKEMGTPGSTTSVMFIPGSECVDKAPEYDEYGVRTGKVLNFMYGVSRKEPNGIVRPAYSDKEKAKEWILRHREVLSKRVDPTDLRQFIKAYPLSLDEVLESSAEALLSPDLMELVTAQKKMLTTSPNPSRTFNEYAIKYSNGNIVVRPAEGLERRAY